MAYKVFTNGSPLPASDLNTYLMNQSVMVFANSTARSAALTSPTEGMTTYLEDTNKVEVWTGAAWTDINDNSAMIPKSTVTATGDLIVGNGNASVTRLGIGTNGQVLSSNGTTATWTNPASGGGMTLLSTTSLSGTSVTVTGISQAYKDLVIDLVNYYTTNNDVGIRLKFKNSSGTDLNIAAGGRERSSNVWGDYNSSGTTVSLTEYSSSLSTLLSAQRITVTNYANSTEVRPFTWYGQNQGSNDVVQFGSGGIKDRTNAVSQIQVFTTGSTNNFLGGTLRIYGVS